MFEICYIHFVKDFDNIQEASDDLSRRTYVDHSERNFTDLFNFNNIAADKDSSDSVKERDSESNEREKWRSALGKKWVEENTK